MPRHDRLPKGAGQANAGAQARNRAGPSDDGAFVRRRRSSFAIPADDLILPFQAEQADVSGRLVKLGPVVDTILSRHDYPEPVSQLLGEAVALTALLGAALKFEGKFILQASTDGPVDLLVADYQVPGGLRGYARFSPERLAALAARRASSRAGPSRHDHRPRAPRPSAIRAWCRSKAKA